MTRGDSPIQPDAPTPRAFLRIKFLKALHERLEFQQTGVAREFSIQNPTLQNPNRSYQRIASIDFVRGLAMVFMALDHTRDFICNIPFEPENIDKTWTFYFLVRWVTHFCAPAFFLLAGAGAYLYGRKHSPAALQKFLVTRGIWLVVLEFTVIGFAWTFHPGWGVFGVICCLGLSMILLAAFVRLPRYLTMAVALSTIAAHDLFDGLKPSDFHAHQWLLFVLHRSGRAHIGEISLFVLFPLIPWCAVTLLGFAMGSFFESNSASSRRTLLWTGAGTLVLFVLLRATNAYGNPNALIAHSTPGDWHPLPTLSKTIILFLDVEKYPPSLQYLLMTLGPILILLAIGGASFWGWFGRAIEAYGRVPLFFYILHLYVIHLARASRIPHPSTRSLALSRWFFSQLPSRRAALWARTGCCLRDVGWRGSTPLLALRLVRTRQEEPPRLAIAVPLIAASIAALGIKKNDFSRGGTASSSHIHRADLDQHTARSFIVETIGRRSTSP